MPATVPTSPHPRGARATGYAVLALLAGLLAALVTFVVREARAPGHEVRVEFPAVGTLMAGDPVLEQGVAVGRVRAIERHPDDTERTVVVLRLDHAGPLPADTRFLNQPRSVMGARAVWITRPDAPGTDAPPPPALAGIFAGTYVPGLPELLHAATGLPALVRDLQAAVEEAVTAGSIGGSGPLAAAFAAAFAADASIRALTRRLEAFDRALDAAGDSARRGTARAAAAAHTLDAGLAAAEPVLDGFAGRAGDGLARLDSITTALSAALEEAEAALIAARTHLGPEGSLGDHARYDAVAKNARALDSLLRHLRERGLGEDVKVRPRL